jgi:sulfatase modifying factor 1
MASKAFAALLVAGAITPAAQPARADTRDRPAAARADSTERRSCPSGMARVREFCIDRWEVSLVDRATGEPLSPFYPPHPRLLRRVFEVWQVERLNFGPADARAMPLPELPRVQRALRFEPRAVTQPGVIPQGYLSYYTARQACTNAGKRLCGQEEWLTACRGQGGRPFPYGDQYAAGKCNVHRLFHPAFELHGDSSLGHTDPRLNLLRENERDPLLRATGSSPGCTSHWGDNDLYDLVGNLDEWVEAEQGLFLGGFYARGTTKGCESRIASHAKTYYDYSLGTRCCMDPS